MMNYNAVVQAVVDPLDTPEGAASRIWGSLAALVVFPSIFFALAYTRFLRMDIR